jgi:iron(II)-dependent oxidoreductase
MTLARTRDAYLGLDNPTPQEWDTWYRAMLLERESVLAHSKIDLTAYADPETAWSDTAFRQVFLFMYDASFYDSVGGRYRTEDLIERWTAMYGRVDSVLLWHAYPRLGFDSRTQFCFYRDMPGGIARLRTDVTDVLHTRGTRVFVDYNPWDAGTYEELAEVVLGLDADGVMLDTMTDVPERLVTAVGQRKRGVVFCPELMPSDADLGRFRQSWAQWYDIGNASTPSVYRHRWLVPPHRQMATRRWDTSRKHDIVYSFFNGSGLILWDNVFGAWNPYSREDRRLIAETAAVLDRYQDLFVHGEWQPLIPTGVPGLDANLWIAEGEGTAKAKPAAAIITLRNRTKQRVSYRVTSPAPAGLVWVPFWGEKPEVSPANTVAVDPLGVQAIVLDDLASAGEALAHFRLLSERAGVEIPGYDERSPRPRPVHTRDLRPLTAPASPPSTRTVTTSMVELPAGVFQMRIVHERRECGCYPFGATDEAMWGFSHKDVLVHCIRVPLGSFAIRMTAVTNSDFLQFVHQSVYTPKCSQGFLKHIVRRKDGTLPTKLPSEQQSLPVTFVSLADARAYAAWRGQRLPTEAEWQWAAEGAGAGNRYPWGSEERTFPPEIRPAFDPETATPQGIMGLSGNTWELTESEYTDGHTRFVMLRGGIFLPPGESEWLPARGARPNDSHNKYVLLSDELDRSDTISFRTVLDLPADSKRAC